MKQMAMMPPNKRRPRIGRTRGLADSQLQAVKPNFEIRSIELTVGLRILKSRCIYLRALLLPPMACRAHAVELRARRRGSRPFAFPYAGSKESRYLTSDLHNIIRVVQVGLVTTIIDIHSPSIDTVLLCQVTRLCRVTSMAPLPAGCAKAQLSRWHLPLSQNSQTIGVCRSPL